MRLCDYDGMRYALQTAALCACDVPCPKIHRTIEGERTQAPLMVRHLFGWLEVLYSAICARPVYTYELHTTDGGFCGRLPSHLPKSRMEDTRALS